MNKKTIGLFLSACCSTYALANDGIGYLSMGGIVLGKTNDIAMKKEVLNISYKKISVDYEFINEGSKTLEETIIFPLPEYTANYGMHDQYYGEPYNFIIEVNGKKVNYTTQVKAIHSSKDITKTLQGLGLTNEQIAYFPMSSPFNIKVKPLTKVQLSSLLKLNLVEQSPSDSDLIPTWSIQASYIWKQSFKPNEMIKVHHAYTPFVAAGPGASYIDKDIIKDYCMDKSFIKGMDKLKISEYIPVYQVSYILKSGNSWKNGIEDFTLNLQKDHSQELVSLCFPGEFKKINPTTLQVHLTNFKPTKDLLIYFANYKNESNDNTESKAIQLK